MNNYATTAKVYNRDGKQRTWYLDSMLRGTYLFSHINDDLRRLSNTPNIAQYAVFEYQFNVAFVWESRTEEERQREIADSVYWPILIACQRSTDTVDIKPVDGMICCCYNGRRRNLDGPRICRVMVHVRWKREVEDREQFKIIQNMAYQVYYDASRIRHDRRSTRFGQHVFNTGKVIRAEIWPLINQYDGPVVVKEEDVDE